MLLFRSEEMVDRWCTRNGVERGEVLSLAETWELSKLWYSTRLSVDYHGRTTEEADEIFRKAGLLSTFWHR